MSQPTATDPPVANKYGSVRKKVRSGSNARVLLIQGQGFLGIGPSKDVVKIKAKIDVVVLSVRGLSSKLEGEEPLPSFKPSCAQATSSG